MENGGEMETTWHQVFGSKYKFGKSTAYNFKKWAAAVGLEKLVFFGWNRKVTLKQVCTVFSQLI